MGSKAVPQRACTDVLSNPSLFCVAFYNGIYTSGTVGLLVGPFKKPVQGLVEPEIDTIFI
jgi:hypothetical protein